MVLGEEGLGEFAQVEPPEGSVLEGAVIEVEAASIVTLLKKTETASEGGLDPTVESVGVVGRI